MYRRKLYALLLVSIVLIFTGLSELGIYYSISVNAAEQKLPESIAGLKVKLKFNSLKNTLIELPAGTSLSEIIQVNNDFYLVQPDKTVIHIENGAISIPTLIIGGVEISKEALSLAFTNSDINIAEGGERGPFDVFENDPGTKHSYAEVEVHFATDRQKTQSTEPNNIFGAGRGAKLRFGICHVSIPRDHKMGSLERPSMWRLQFSENSDKHLVLLGVTEQTEKDFYSSIKKRNKNGEVFIFIHGYNVEFAEAARRTAQLHYDLAFEGIPMFYSWPSEGKFKSYLTDQTNIEWAKPNLLSFLTKLAERNDIKKIHIIAHSMGSRLLSKVLPALLEIRKKNASKFSEVILAAPDIDAEIFNRDIAPHFAKSTTFVTIYSSSKDKAIAASKEFHKYPRLGESPEFAIGNDNIEAIDASKLKTDFLGHSYYAETKSVVSDLFDLLRVGLRASTRPRLQVANTNHGKYWIINPSEKMPVLSKEEIKRLIHRALERFTVGRAISGRGLLQQAAVGGSAHAALLLGSTYDRGLHFKRDLIQKGYVKWDFVMPWRDGSVFHSKYFNPEQARFWYLQAIKLGSLRARQALKDLKVK